MFLFDDIAPQVCSGSGWNVGNGAERRRTRMVLGWKPGESGGGGNYGGFDVR